MSGDAELDALLAELEGVSPAQPAASADDELDRLLAELNAPAAPAAAASTGDAELDALLASLDAPAESGEPLVIIFGSQYTKVGRAGDDNCKFVIPTIAARPNDGSKMIFGDMVNSRRSKSKVSEFFKGSFSDDWEAVEGFLHEIFYNHAKVAPESVPVFVVGGVEVTDREYKGLADILYNTFGVKKLIISDKRAPMASARMDAVEVLLGDQKPVVFSTADYATLATEYFAVSYSDMVMALRAKLTELNDAFGMNSGIAMARDVLKTHAVVSTTPLKSSGAAALDDLDSLLSGGSGVSSASSGHDASLDETVTYELPDGSEVKFPKMMIASIFESIFQPELLNKSGLSLPQAIEKVVEASKSNATFARKFKSTVRVELMNKSFQIEGMKDRVIHELKSIGINPDLRDPSHLHEPWLSVSVLGSMDACKPKFVDKATYTAKGASAFSSLKFM